MEHQCKQEKLIGTLEEANAGMIRWQHAQNGSLKRIEAKTDRLLWLILMTIGGVTVNLVVLLLNR